MVATPSSQEEQAVVRLPACDASVMHNKLKKKKKVAKNLTFINYYDNIIKELHCDALWDFQ